MVYFQCQTSSGGDLCFNGGSCSNSTIDGDPKTLYFTCECPGGWTHDNMWFHQPNCVMPENFYEWFIITFSILTVLFSLHIIKVIVFNVKKNELKILVAYHLMTLFLHWLICLCLYLQQGFFEAAIIAHLISILWSVYQMYMTMLHLVVKPLLIGSSSSKETIKRAYRLHAIPAICNGIVFTSIFTVMACICRTTPQQNTYNWFVCVFMFAFTLANILHIVTARPLERRFYQLLELAGTSASPMFTKIKENAEKSKTEMNQMMFLIAIGQVPIVIVFLVLGSFPYFFIYQSVYLLQIFPISFIVAHFFTKSAGNSSTADGNQLTMTASQWKEKDNEGSGAMVLVATNPAGPTVTGGGGASLRLRNSAKIAQAEVQHDPLKQDQDNNNNRNGNSGISQTAEGDGAE